MSVVGIDTSTRAVHWVGPGRKWGLLQADGNEVEQRRIELLRASRNLARSLEPGTHVFIEEPLSLKNGKTNRLLALAAGAIWAGLVVDQLDLWVYWVDVASWKKAVVGRGNVDKAGVRAFVQENPAWLHERYDPVLWDSEPDLYDAWCIRVYGRRF